MSEPIPGRAIGGGEAGGAGRAMLLLLPLAAFALHLAFIHGYGYFRDELYYLACARHPAWGYVDQPPLSIWVLWVVMHTLGSSLVAIRLLPDVLASHRSAKAFVRLPADVVEPEAAEAPGPQPAPAGRRRL